MKLCILLDNGTQIDTELMFFFLTVYEATKENKISGIKIIYEYIKLHRIFDLEHKLANSKLIWEYLDEYYLVLSDMRIIQGRIVQQSKKTELK